MSTILFRADASFHIGTGHLRRCLTLAETLREQKHEVLFLTDASLNGNLCHEIKERGFAYLPLEEQDPDVTVFENLFSHHSSLKSLPLFDWLIVDHYDLDKTFEKKMRPFFKKIGIIDDLFDKPHEADLVLNQNLCDNMEERQKALYPPHCKALLGTNYFLLRKDIQTIRQQYEKEENHFWLTASPPPLKRILVNFGGVDPHGMTPLVLEAILPLLKEHELTAIVVLGKQNNTVPKLQEITQQCPQHVELHLSPPDIGSVFASAHMAIGAGGTSLYERYALGLPSIIIPVASNQEEIVSYAHKNAWGLTLPFWDPTKTPYQLPIILQSVIETPTVLQDIFQATYPLVDGKGTSRVAQSLSELLDKAPLSQR